jgi:hypothetical protein
MGITALAAGQRATAAQINSLPVVTSYLSTGSVTNTTSETIIGTFTIAAGDPAFPGGYRFEVVGTAAQSGTPNVSMRVRLNSTSGALLFSATGVSFSAASTPFAFDGFIMFSAIGASGAFYGSVIMNSNFGGAATAVLTPGIPNNVAINTTISNTIVVTAQFSAASSSDTVTTIGGAMYRL